MSNTTSTGWRFSRAAKGSIAVAALLVIGIATGDVAAAVQHTENDAPASATPAPSAPANEHEGHGEAEAPTENEPTAPTTDSPSEEDAPSGEHGEHEGEAPSTEAVAEATAQALAAGIMPAGVTASFAYAQRNWTPTAYDTCPASLHEQYSVVGDDNKLYPTWHPPVVINPATGAECSFGHEHGDNPADSDIATWVSEFYTKAADGYATGIPFGYVSEALVDFSAAQADVAVRHEDNVGHKIIVANDVAQIQAAPRAPLTTTDSAGAAVPLTCDYLIKIHQGSHSADATTNNAHELLYAVKCTDGTEVISNTMTRFGDPNEFVRSCAGTQVVDTSGSVLPNGIGGERRIPDRKCIEDFVLLPTTQTTKYSDPWALYEVWESANEISAVDGTVLAKFDPWFGVRNPSRYFWKGNGTNGADGIGFTVQASHEVGPSGGGVNAGPWKSLLGGGVLLQQDPASPFDGSERDYYLDATTVNNTASSTWFATPYGEDAVAEPFTGSVRQWVSATDNSAQPPLERRQFGMTTDYGSDHGVHAPN
ncbi:hypothetical protein [Lysinibacter cavernae]|uniref:Uncharacterized protein n=1 Tax=Lysinibacter cavernae TaxID=1640652 RepID=A0A7X5TTR3_9MICO|nr:hypothetical protein [Lysinibacter cavernae]NIH53558.1 hypothetical protein [Lysinibacter cavernae]